MSHKTTFELTLFNDEEELPKKIPRFITEVTIKKGTIVMQDRSFFKWSAEDIIFTGEWTENFWICKADGYGNPGNYGSGAVFVKGYDAVEQLKCKP